MADGDRWQGRPAQPSAMQRAFDDATNRLAQRLEAESISPPPPLRRPSRLMLTATPAPGRLEAAAANKDLDEARALCGTAWTNRLAALLPDGWRLGPCVGVGDGERLEPPCFDKLESTSLVSLHRAIGGGVQGSQFHSQLPLPERGRGQDHFGWEDTWLVRSSLSGPGSTCPPCFRYPPLRRDGKFNGLLFETYRRSLYTELQDAARRQDGPQRFIEAPPGSAIRNFYGRVKKHRIATGLYYRGVLPRPRFRSADRPSGARARTCTFLRRGHGPRARGSSPSPTATDRSAGCPA